MVVILRKGLVGQQKDYLMMMPASGSFFALQSHFFDIDRSQAPAARLAALVSLSSAEF